MFNSCRNIVAAAALALMMATLTPATAAEDPYEIGPPSAAAMGADVLLVRPLGFVATVAGTGLFLLSLPFSLLGSNTDEAARRLVAEPAGFTFVRPIGDFETGYGYD